jgi:hypothetical protein
LLAEFVRLNPRIRILACSGYFAGLFDLPCGGRRRLRFLQKPFSPEMLARAIEELLSEPA